MIAAALLVLSMSSRLPVPGYEIGSRLPVAGSRNGSANPQPVPGNRQPVTGNSIDLHLVTYNQWQNELASMRGHIVVVDLWATWCAPCVGRFPKMMAMAKKWEPKGVRFVSLSLDDKNERGSFDQVLKFLRDHEARIPNFMMNEVLPDAFDKLNINAVPAVFIYDRGGRQRYRLTGDDPNHQFTEADVEAALKNLTGTS